LNKNEHFSKVLSPKTYKLVVVNDHP